MYIRWEVVRYYPIPLYFTFSIVSILIVIAYYWEAIAKTLRSTDCFRITSLVHFNGLWLLASDFNPGWFRLRNKGFKLSLLHPLNDRNFMRDRAFLSDTITPIQDRSLRQISFVPRLIV
jgi:hypothetical protein